MDSSDPMKRIFEVVKARSAERANGDTCLEEELMNVFDKQRAKSAIVRKLTLALIMVGALFGVTAIGFATEGFTKWPWTVRVGQDGKVRDENGSVVGQTIKNADGSTTIMVQTSPTTGLMGPSSQPVQGEKIQIGAKPYAPGDK